MNIQNRRLFDVRNQLWIPLAVILLSLLTGCSSAASAGPTTITSSPQATIQSTTVQTGGLQKPSIPTTGAYIGAWVDPVGMKKTTPVPGDSDYAAREIAQLPAFNQAIGTHVEILHLYSPFTDPLPIQTMNLVEQNGSIPMVDWYCGNVTQIDSGSYDSLITTYAQGMKNFAKPVFLRWYWEMNLNDSGHKSCGASNNPASFVTAWQHIWTIFQNVGASNVAFVWSPSGDNDAATFYPGDKYVDWIGIDHYDIPNRNGSGASAVTSLFDSFYKEWSGHNKPMMIAETGAHAGSQTVFFQALQAAFTSQYPDFKALMYFDAPGTGHPSQGPWVLQGDGYSSFGALSKSSYFSYGRNS